MQNDLPKAAQQLTAGPEWELKLQTLSPIVGYKASAPVGGALSPPPLFLSPLQSQHS